MFSPLSRSNYPEAYSIRFDREHVAIILEFSPEATQTIPERVKAYARNDLSHLCPTELGTFEATPERLGFGGVLASTDGGATWTIPIPRPPSGRSGAQSAWTRPLVDIVATLHLLFQQFHMDFKNPLEPDAPGPFQICDINLLPPVGGRNCGIAGWLSPGAANLHRETFIESDAIHVQEALRSTWQRLFNKKDLGLDKHSLNANLMSSQLFMSVPGEGCTLSMSHQHAPGNGWEFSDHNVDDPLQAIAFLAGLADHCDTLRYARDVLQATG